MNVLLALLGVILVFLSLGMITLLEEWFITAEAIELGQIILLLVVFLGLYFMVWGVMSKDNYGYR